MSEGDLKVPTEQEFSPRFVLESPKAPEGLALERLRALQATILEARQDYPEIAGATVFGSTVKGRVKPKSDIDGFIFIDEDVATAAGRPHRLFMYAGNQPEVWIDETKSDQPYKDLILRGLWNRLRLQPDHIDGFTVLPISSAVVQVSVVDAVEEKRKGETDVVNSNIRGLFHFGILNRPLDRFRAQVVNDLRQHGDTGEEVWGELVDDVLLYEKGRKGQDVYFPRNLDEATRVYIPTVLLRK